MPYADLRDAGRIHWVAGHVGIPENERADELANQGVEESKLTSR